MTSGKDIDPETGPARARLVETLRRKGICNADVLAAMQNVPRHRFIAPDQQGQAYADHALPIGHDQTISQPFVVAVMTEKLLANSAQHQNVLEIGTGCGYQTAVLARVFGQVYSIERIEALAALAQKTLASLDITNVSLRHGDGTRGWPDRVDFDAVLVTAAAETVPDPLLSLLSPGGCLVAPIGERWSQRLRTVTRKDDGLHTVDAEGVRFVPLLAGTRC